MRIAKEHDPQSPVVPFRPFHSFDICGAFAERQGEGVMIYHLYRRFDPDSSGRIRGALPPTHTPGEQQPGTLPNTCRSS